MSYMELKGYGDSGVEIKLGTAAPPRPRVSWSECQAPFPHPAHTVFDTCDKRENHTGPHLNRKFGPWGPVEAWAWHPSLKPHPFVLKAWCDTGGLR